MPSAVTHQSHIRSPDEVTASVRPLPTPLSWSPIDSTRNFGVKGNHRRDPPTARDRPFMQPAGNVTLSNYAALEEAGGPPVQWLAGSSAGAVAAALIAGNPPGQRVTRLREFWEGVAGDPNPAATFLLG